VTDGRTVSPDRQERRVLVTGSSGCLGAWVVRLLLDRGHIPIALDITSDRHRLELLLTPDELRDLTFVNGDVTSPESLDEAIEHNGVDGVIHLAALQVPFCAADPALGARVNVVGTVNVFEAVKRHRDAVTALVYASSAAVYGPDDKRRPSPVPEDEPGHPGTLYGVYKQANEGTAKVYWESDEIGSIGLRPYVVFGLGRDQGMTSSPTKAMLAAALGRSYTISYGGRSQLHFARDAADAFVSALDKSASDARVFNLGGPATDAVEMVDILERLVPDIRGQISIADAVLPFPESFATSIETHLPDVRRTPLEDAIAETINAFRRAVNDGKISTAGLA
jgi:UDP-glucuronate 4-epimerase